ncbi:MAG: hypothetical protein ONB48_09705 [candidate division KSB1 bacterium]|nr:hypothetical protein [candidate division KSB1 bacterium]MDZ7273762.1 hypothetical protein [candidate division KSB1 bacterium]MDZ7285918.1 hypothetical protein [candidate division KSB1 bacterium]MDZ7298950.1 hypothetical protein [candidate division KSB1 bacterium]MDZ7349905.1 hypothetical protein [candidate division KSB1 bacterium]
MKKFLSKQSFGWSNLLFLIAMAFAQQPVPAPEQFQWKNSSIGGGGFCMEIRIDPFDNYSQSGNPVLYLATDVSSVYRSFDRGVSWEMLFYEASLEKNTLARYTTSLAFRPTGSRRIIAGTVEGIYL